MDSKYSENIEVPVLPLRDIVIYPNIVMPLFIGREKSIKCLDLAIDKDKKIMLVAQKNSSVDDPNIKDLFSIGTISSVLQFLKLPDGTVKILVEGLSRANILELTNKNNCLFAKIQYINSTNFSIKEKNLLLRTIISQFEEYIKLNKRIPLEIISILNNLSNTDRIIDTIAAHMPLKLSKKQSILEIYDVFKRLKYLMQTIELEIDLLRVEKKIRNRIKQQMEKSQKEYYLNEQIKAIQKELGNIDNINDEYEILKNKILKSRMPKEPREKTENELQKLKLMSPISAEATVVRGYIDWMISIPWKSRSRLKKNLFYAKKILDNDHYGLDKVKERILEHLAVQNRVKKIKGSILCLVGPPGVGKTSLGISISKATGRKYIRMALGGIRDEAEIRGHRKTYVGAMPGKIIQKISKSGVKNPLFLLDEIDKMSYDFRGDPSSALLEVLDPEQNIMFNDHYLEVDYDLSEVMFIATSNSMNILTPLLDRMEVIKLTGYTEEEKFNIAKQYLILKQMKRHSLKIQELTIKDEVILSIIRFYTREAGVRGLEREIAKICRKTVKKLLINNIKDKINIDNSNIKKFLGIKKFNYEKAENNDKIGRVTGLAWTEVGGELLTIEVACVSGKGNLIHTGSLGKVMQESIQTALTVVKSKAEKLKININLYEKLDIHVHVPEGATPKDGPSAGMAICIALISSLSNNPVKSNIAMTGEITLHGKILPIGGLKEKLLAAHRGGIKTVLIPADNKRNLEEMPNILINSLNIHQIHDIDEVLNLALKNKFLLI